jgi:putative transposase
MTRKTEVIRHIPEKKLEQLYREEKNTRIKERLHTILLLYRGYRADETAEILRRSYATVRRWKDAWNAGGYEGLKPSYKGNPNPRISSSTWDQILEDIKERGMTLKDVQVYVNTKYGANYSYSNVWHWVRKKKKMPYGKPYPRDTRRPENAEEILKKPRQNPQRC